MATASKVDALLRVPLLIRLVDLTLVADPGEPVPFIWSVVCEKDGLALVFPPAAVSMNWFLTDLLIQSSECENCVRFPPRWRKKVLWQ